VDGEKIVFCIGLHKNPEEVTFEDCLKISSFIYNLQKNNNNKGKITQFTTYNNEVVMSQPICLFISIGFF